MHILMLLLGLGITLNDAIMLRRRIAVVECGARMASENDTEFLMAAWN
jgi:hypothetical protein